MTTTANDMFASIAGQTIPGGCDDCAAEQTVREEPGYPGVWRMTVAHDDTCPWFAARRASR